MGTCPTREGCYSMCIPGVLEELKSNSRLVLLCDIPTPLGYTWNSNILLLDRLTGLAGSLNLTVLYLADRSRTMDLLYGLTGSLVLTVLYLTDGSKTMGL